MMLVRCVWIEMDRKSWASSGLDEGGREGKGGGEEDEGEEEKGKEGHTA